MHHSLNQAVDIAAQALDALLRHAAVSKNTRAVIRFTLSPEAHMLPAGKSPAPFKTQRPRKPAADVPAGFRASGPHHNRSYPMSKKAHPGFAGAAREVERKEGVSKQSAEKIIGAGKANASAAARKANPNLNKKGGR